MTLITSVMAYSAWGLLAIRLSLAATFLKHGSMKLGMWKMQPSEQMPKGQLAMMRFLSIAEIAGGLGVLVGLLTQWAALGLCIVMLGAMYFKIFKWKLPFAELTKNGWEFDVILFAGALMVFLAGPGMWAIDLLF